MLRNEWPASVGIGGRLRLESVADINRNRRPEWIGIRNKGEEPPFELIIQAQKIGRLAHISEHRLNKLLIG
jgi:hypothetical protein